VPPSGFLSNESKPPAPPERTFEVRHYEVLGNTVLPAETVDGAFTNAVGAQVSLSQVQQALGALQLAYRERGFATVSVGLPQQQITNATIKVQVTEGVLSDIRVTGNRHFSSNNIVRALPSLKTNELLNSRVFQRELDSANQNRDRQIFPVLGPGAEPGTSSLTLRVKDRLPLHGRIEVNNHNTPGTPDWRLNSSAQYNNLWQLDHQLGLSYGFTPEEFKQGDPSPDYLLNRPLIANLGAYYRLPLRQAQPFPRPRPEARRGLEPARPRRRTGRHRPSPRHRTVLHRRPQQCPRVLRGGRVRRSRLVWQSGTPVTLPPGTRAGRL
jgi:hemolysin activation/secretion protein